MTTLSRAEDGTVFLFGQEQYCSPTQNCRQPPFLPQRDGAPPKPAWPAYLAPDGGPHRSCVRCIRDDDTARRGARTRCRGCENAPSSGDVTRILRNAMRLFTERGYEATTVADIGGGRRTRPPHAEQLLPEQDRHGHRRRRRDRGRTRRSALRLVRRRLRLRHRARPLARRTGLDRRRRAHPAVRRHARRQPRPCARSAAATSPPRPPSAPPRSRANSACRPSIPPSPSARAPSATRSAATSARSPSRASTNTCTAGSSACSPRCSATPAHRSADAENRGGGGVLDVEDIEESHRDQRGLERPGAGPRRPRTPRCPAPGPPAPSHCRWSP